MGLLGCHKGDSRLFYWFSASQLVHICLASYQGTSQLKCFPWASLLQGVAWWHNGRALDLRSRGRGFDSRVGAQLRNERGQVAHTRLPRRRQSSLLYGVVKPGTFTSLLHGGPSWKRQHPFKDKPHNVWWWWWQAISHCSHTWTRTLLQSPAFTSDLATQRAAYAADLSTFEKSLPEKAPPPWAPQPPYVSTIILRPVKPASPWQQPSTCAAAWCTMHAKLRNEVLNEQLILAIIHNAP